MYIKQFSKHFIRRKIKGSEAEKRGLLSDGEQEIPAVKWKQKGKEIYGPYCFRDNKRSLGWKERDLWGKGQDNREDRMGREGGNGNWWREEEGREEDSVVDLEDVVVEVVTAVEEAVAAVVHAVKQRRKNGFR